MSDDEIGREVERQLERVRGNAEEILGEEDLRERLADSLRRHTPLRIKFGADPSAPDLHLGHTVVLETLRRFQELGHTPVFLIGDFTACIGDPSGKRKTRPALSRELVQQNASTYVEQVGRVLDTTRAEIRFNSEWMDRLSSSDILRLCSHYTVARLLERDDFAKRFHAEEPIAVHELLYPFVQAYDSVALRADVELGGTDQRFNLLMAREIQRAYGQPPQAVVVHPLLVGIDGVEKMSKSLGNAIGITEAAEEIYGKTMRISDPVMLTYFDRLSGGAWEDLRAERERVGRGEGDPLALKQGIAFRLVARFQGSNAAKAAADHFRRVVQLGEAPGDLPERKVALGDGTSLGLLDLLERLELVASRSEARRLLAEGAIHVNGERARDAGQRLGAGSYLIRAGRRRFARVRIV